MIEEVPVLFGEPLSPYFVMLGLGFALATWLGVRWAKNLGLDHEVIIDLGLYSVIAGVLGGRVLHVFADGYFWDYVHLCTDPSQVRWQITAAECRYAEGIWNAKEGVCQPSGRDCFAWAAFWRGGLAYYGGLIAAVGAAWVLLRRERFPFWKAADMAGFAVPFGLCFGRLGCFLGGCCFGSRWDGVWAVRYPAYSPASDAHAKLELIAHKGLRSLSVHPTQLYEAAGCLLISIIALYALHPRKRFDGQVFLFFLGAYAVLRFVLEWLRADERGGFAGLSTSQWIGVVILGACVPLYNALRNKPPGAGPRPTSI